MRKRIAITLSVCTIWSAAAIAQNPPSPNPAALPPTFSPYLNLNRAGTSSALNYYGLVRPEISTRHALNGVQSAVSLNQQSIADLQTGFGSAPTGVVGQFFNHQLYFMNNNRVGGLPGSGSSSAGTGVGGNFGLQKTQASAPAGPSGPQPLPGGKK